MYIHSRDKKCYCSTRTPILTLQLRSRTPILTVQLRSCIKQNGLKGLLCIFNKNIEVQMYYFCQAKNN